MINLKFNPLLYFRYFLKRNPLHRMCANILNSLAVQRCSSGEICDVQHLCFNNKLTLAKNETRSRFSKSIRIFFFYHSFDIHNCIHVENFGAV